VIRPDALTYDVFPRRRAHKDDVRIEFGGHTLTAGVSAERKEKEGHTAI